MSEQTRVDLERAYARAQKRGVQIMGRWLQLSAARRRRAILLNYVAALAALQAIIG